MTKHDRQTLFCLSTLLRYPDEDLLLFLRDLHGGRYHPDHDVHSDVTAFIARAASTNISILQKNYMEAFDRDAASNLHLTRHIHGHSSLQSRALAALREIYRDAGFHLLSGERPDYLPIMLEFIAAGPDWAAACLCDPFSSVVAGLAERVGKNDRSYALLLHVTANVLSAAQPMEACA